MTKAQAYARDQQEADFKELKRMIQVHGRGTIEDMLTDAHLELIFDRGDEKEAEDCYNDPRGERRPAIPTHQKESRNV